MPLTKDGIRIAPQITARVKRRVSNLYRAQGVIFFLHFFYHSEIVSEDN
jgi:hypothetical protein